MNQVDLLITLLAERNLSSEIFDMENSVRLQI